MHLLVKNNFLHTKTKVFRCSIGKNGLTRNKTEGDLCTPIGEFKFERIFYREDKIKEINFLLPSDVISKNDGWCDDPNSKFYNQHIKFPFNESAEQLYRSDDLYDLICVINYNTNPILHGKGSAIFLHIAKPHFESTEGCVAINKEDLITLVQQIDAHSTITISN